MATGGSSATGATKPLLTLPPRPATLSVAGIDPCALVPKDKRAELEIDQPATTDPGVTDPVILGTLCSYSVSAWGGYLFELSDKFTARNWIDRTKMRAAYNTLVDVDGYPTVRAYSPKQPASCLILVDISDSAVLYVASDDRRDYAAGDGKIVCANAIKAAGVALTALKGMQK